MQYLSNIGALRGIPKQETLVHYCRFGASYRKPTIFYSFGSFRPRSLAKTCTKGTRRRRETSCGRLVHTTLGFDGLPTAGAAAYPPQLCAAYASDLLGFERSLSAPMRAVCKSSGKVRRHIDRGASRQSAREVKAAEDDKSTAGARNTFDVISAWPSYQSAMLPVRSSLLEAIRSHPDLQGIAGACGQNPSRSPPHASAVSWARKLVAESFGLTPAQAEWHHAASPWRPELISAVLSAAGDPDVEVPTWLSEGAPVGVNVAIRPGGHLPRIHESPELASEDLIGADTYTHNHASFDAESDDERPAHQLLSELVSSGHALVFHSAAHAEAWLGKTPVPSPLADVMKPRPDGTIKHRLIQDLRASRVNQASAVPERQVLPRFRDHTIELLRATAAGEEVEVLILDFKNAFMSIPLHPLEQHLNCTPVPAGVARGRQQLYEGEPVQGKFLVWRVLGFGGHANPLIFSRIATFAARSAQALLAGDPATSGLGQVRIQLYVDDPVITVSGAPPQRREALDVLLLWWLVLGIPLAWDKGVLCFAETPHLWIGVIFQALLDGSVLLTLPAQFVAEFLDLLSQFVTGRGSAPVAVARKLCGRAGRVAHIVQETQPWATALHTALSEALEAERHGRREAPPNHVACRRFAAAARWMYMAFSNSDGTVPRVHHRFSWSNPQHRDRRSCTSSSMRACGGVVRSWWRTRSLWSTSS